MTQILIVCAVSMIICGVYTFILPAYDWMMRQRTARTNRSTRSVSATQHQVISKHPVV